MRIGFLIARNTYLNLAFSKSFLSFAEQKREFEPGSDAGRNPVKWLADFSNQGKHHAKPPKH